MRSRVVDLSALQAAAEVRPPWRTETTREPEVLAMSKKHEAEIKARLKEFWDDHKDFDSPWARYVLGELSEMLAFVFQPISPGLEQLYVDSGVRIPRDFGDWFEADSLPAA